MRIAPNKKYDGLPCSYVGTGCACERITGKPFEAPLPDGLKDDGYLSLESANKFLRAYLPVSRKVYFKRTERITLGEFLQSNDQKCCICVLGHFLYAEGHDYWSFFENEDDPVVCVWYLKEEC